LIKNISKIFFKGVLGVLPLTLSLYFIYWFFTSMETLFDSYLMKVLPDAVRFPGVGVASGFFVIFGIGLLLSTPFFANIHKLILKPVRNIPLVKSVYSAIEDLMSYFAPSDDKTVSKVVKVNLPGQSFELVGLLTQDELDSIEGIAFAPDKVAVFIPMSYALGGYTIFVPRDCLVVTDMKVEQAMKLALTSWMKKKNV
tara:strand:- start:43509 stop:44102 length:594 start_codon:yes stop_codon:yes gene_type:complete